LPIRVGGTFRRFTYDLFGWLQQLRMTSGAGMAT
jgi:hypothetical protein